MRPISTISHEAPRVAMIPKAEGVKNKEIEVYNIEIAIALAYGGMQHSLASHRCNPTVTGLSCKARNSGSQ